MTACQPVICLGRDVTSNNDWSEEWRETLKKKIPPAKWAAMTPEQQEAALRAENGSVKAGWGCVGIIALLFVLGSLFGGRDHDGYTPDAAREAYDQRGSTSPERVLRDAGVDSDAYMREATELGVDPSEAVAADIIICSETGDCPRGMTQSEARELRRRLQP